MKILSSIILIVSFIFAVDYQSQIQPIFNANCGNCHLGNSSGGLNLSTYDNLMEGSDDGAVIIPGNHEQSILWDEINTGSMPAGNNPELSDEEIDLIAQWIDEGALEEEAQVEGCTDPNAITCDDILVDPYFPACDTCSEDIPCENYYNEDAVVDNGLCMYNVIPEYDQFFIDILENGFQLDWSAFSPPVEITQYVMQRCVDIDADGDGNFDDDGDGEFEYENCVMLIDQYEPYYLDTSYFDEYSLEDDNPMKYTLYVDYPNNVYWGSAHGYYYYEGGENLCTLGDVNLDSIINVIDIVTLVNYIFGAGSFNDEQLCAGDLNGDGIINVIDIVNVVNIILS